ncbi:C40 family peptidase [Nocardia thailandica]|uniref:C40 family peptidase n=1 Tax=Nocardia thailandica TaxID=257275 RepID=UPI0002ECB2DF|nr:C40 family peptidase [Nocardia thailandica]
MPAGLVWTILGMPLVVLLILILVALGSETPKDCTTGTGHSAGVNGEAGVSVAGLSEAQLALARNGVVIGKQRGMPESVILAELAAQATESSFRNLANSNVPASLGYANDGVGSNYDSVGPHQIRVSVHSDLALADLMDPVFQINWFYDKAEAIPGAETTAPADLAQAIERSSPNAYASQLDLAARLYDEFSGIDTGASAFAAGRFGGCGSGGSGAPLTAAEPSGFGREVIAAAHRWLGTDYVWGGGDADGPTMGGFDCSGLTLYAVYQASGGQIRLAHYTQAQQDDSRAQVVPFADRQPGDLIYFTSPGDADSHHVGVYYGRDEQGRDLLLHAPQTGQTVTITPLSAWDGERMDVRRFGQTAAIGDTSGAPGARS